MNENVNQLMERIAKLEERLDKRDHNQIQFPLDDISRTVLNTGAGIPTQGTGTFGTQSVAVVAGHVTVPNQPSGTIKVLVNGTIIELLKK